MLTRLRWNFARSCVAIFIYAHGWQHNFSGFLLSYPIDQYYTAYLPIRKTCRPNFNKTLKSYHIVIHREKVSFTSPALLVGVDQVVMGERVSSTAPFGSFGSRPGPVLGASTWGLSALRGRFALGVVVRISLGSIWSSQIDRTWALDSKLVKDSCWSFWMSWVAVSSGTLTVARLENFSRLNLEVMLIKRYEDTELSKYSRKKRL